MKHRIRNFDLTETTITDYREHQSKTWKRELLARRRWLAFTQSRFFYPLALTAALIAFPFKHPKGMSFLATTSIIGLTVQAYV